VTARVAAGRTHEFRRPHRPLTVRGANALARVLTRARHGRRPALLDLDEGGLVRAAQRTAGSDDLGPDQEWRPGLRALLASLEGEAGLSPFGRWCARGHVLGCLVNRAELQCEWGRSPELLEQPVSRPLVVLGLPRSGTTLLQNLLALDPANRSLLQWEATRPCPPPRTQTYSTDPRIAQAERTMRLLDHLAPSARALHPVGPQLPTECVTLFANSFASLELAAINATPGYLSWCLATDMAPHYGYYRRQLQLLQWKHPAERWALKSPAHLFWVGDLVAQFPDAALVQLHRDPLEVLASYCSLVCTLQGVGAERVDAPAVARTWALAWADGLRRARTARRQLPTGQVLDLQYTRLVADPVGAVRAVYEHAGLPLPARLPDEVRAYVGANPQHKGGVHRYRLEQFGLDPEVETARFADLRQDA